MVFSDYTTRQKVYLDGSWQDTRVFRLCDVPEGSLINGPAIIIDETQTIFVESLFKAHVLVNYVVAIAQPFYFKDIIYTQRNPESHSTIRVCASFHGHRRANGQHPPANIHLKQHQRTS
ncbi:hypothetical protein LB505_014302 [Fusarium chuoi]|nr:hypothetical protein LB505_014302 [Fusarium chuoi]